LQDQEPVQSWILGRQSTAAGLNYSNQATFGTMAGGIEGARNIGFLGRLAW
jgi:hypothetical protein